MMKKTLLVTMLFFLCLSATSFAANNWRGGTGEDTILGTEDGADIDSASFQNIVDPLDRALAKHRQGCRIAYRSASTLTIEPGEVVLSNATGTIRLMQQNTSDTTVTWADIDAEAEANSTTYYVYAYQNVVTTATFSILISTSSTTPTGGTYFRRLGSFYNNSSGDIERISNDDNIGNQVHQAIGVTNGPTTTSGTYVDLTDMSITMITNDSPVEIIFTGTFSHSTAGPRVNVILDIDGTDKTASGRRTESAVADGTFGLSLNWLENLSAGSHTFKIQWLTTAATATAYGIERVLTVKELK